MNDLQKKIFDILLWFHSFCEQNRLQYYLVAGTMLGAVRHGGFIPWDDDADVAMPRKDYERFIEITSKSSDKYCVESPNKNFGNYPYPFAKVYDSSTTLVEKARKNVFKGVYLDVFPLDGLGVNELDANKYQKKVFFKVNLYNSKICALSKKRKFYKNFAILLSRVCTPFGVRYDKNTNRLNKIATKYSYDESVIITNFFGGWQFKETMLKTIFGKPTLYKFESAYFYGVEHYDEYLTLLYGNYLSLPPEDKRKQQHDFIYLSFDDPYKKC